MKINFSQQSIIGRIIAVALFIAIIAGTWDAWWHGAIGRETLFEPPHLLLYSSVIVAIGLGIYGWIRSREKIWKRLAIILAIVPLSAPFDEIWHRIFGVEDLSSPFIVWSPPHVALILSTMIAIILLLPVLRKDTRDAQILFGSMLFAGIMSLLFFLFSPIGPLGPWHLLGFFGAGMMSIIIIGPLLQ